MAAERLVGNLIGHDFRHCQVLSSVITRTGYRKLDWWRYQSQE
jgi:hypothetical protein